MGAGKKVAIGCGGLLVLAAVAMFLGWRFVQKNYGLTTDPIKIEAMAHGVLPVQIPERFDPLFGMHMEKGLKDPMAIFTDTKSRTSETTLVVFARTGVFDHQAMFNEFNEGGSGMRIQIGDDVAGEEESFPVLWRGQEYPVILQEAIDGGEVLQRSMVVVIPDGERTLLLAVSGAAEDLPSSLIQEILDTDLGESPAVTEGEG